MSLDFARLPGPHRPAKAFRPPSFSCARHLIARGVVRLAVAGELDITTAPLLDRALRGAQGDGELVVVDLAAVEFMDSGCARVLRDADRRVSEAGGRLVAVRVPAPVARLLELTHVHPRLKLVG